MKLKFILCLSMVLLVSFSVYSKKKTRKKKVPVKIEEQTKPTIIQPNTFNTMMLCGSKDGMPAWYLALVKGFTFPPNFKAPQFYRTTSINEEQLNNFLNTVPYDSSNMKITVPLFIDKTLQCKEFTIERVRTMDDELQAKYPDLRSYRVYEQANQLNAGRIDCDGTSTKFMITYNQQVYFIAPVNFKQRLYYACYAKNDPNFQKEEFERRR
ncbi:MAG: hypothetical protein KA198_08665 [Chitinophagaceae bacterium]|nr:hypothetical protein [Chitinophagaceae bacterium]